MTYLALCDSPTLETGFAQVSKNILPRLGIENLHVWALGYNGEAHNFPFRLYPANVNCSWESEHQIEAFHHFISRFSGPRLLWTLHDPFRLNAFANVLALEKRRGLQIASYIPVDSPLSQEDRQFLQLVDLPVAYSNYGAKQIKSICPESEPLVIPHGYDPDFQKLPEDINSKQILFPQAEGKTLIGSVNSNTKRKALHRSLQILKHLKEESDDYMMYLHASPNGYCDLKKVAINLGIFENMIWGDPFFENAQIGNPNCPKETLLGIYNAFDLFLSTSLGEGWGLTSSEAACCEVPLAVPDNTVFPEVYSESSVLWLPTQWNTEYFGKIVPDINPKRCAELIKEFLEKDSHNTTKAKESVQRYNWDDIGRLWRQLLLPAG